MCSGSCLSRSLLAEGRDLHGASRTLLLLHMRLSRVARRVIALLFCFCFFILVFLISLWTVSNLVGSAELVHPEHLAEFGQPLLIFPA